LAGEDHAFREEEPLKRREGKFNLKKVWGGKGGRGFRAIRKIIWWRGGKGRECKIARRRRTQFGIVRSQRGSKSFSQPIVEGKGRGGQWARKKNSPDARKRDLELF